MPVKKCFYKKFAFERKSGILGVGVKTDIQAVTWLENESYSDKRGLRVFP